MRLVLSTFGFSFVSALVPVLNIELYLGVVAAHVGGARAVTLAVPLAVVAALGATAGKVVWYAAAAYSLDSAWVQRKLSKPRVRAGYERWHDRTHGRPWFAAAIMLAASFLGIPPLLVMAVVAGTLKMNLAVFMVSCFVGRALRFYLILAGVSVALA